MRNRLRGIRFSLFFQKFSALEKLSRVNPTQFPSQPSGTPQAKNTGPASGAEAPEDTNEPGIKKWGQRVVIGILSFLGFKNLVTAESSWLRPILYFLSAFGIYKFTGKSKPNSVQHSGDSQNAKRTQQEEMEALAAL